VLEVYREEVSQINVREVLSLFKPMFLFVVTEMKDGGVTWVDLTLLCEQDLDMLATPS
jgi:hypothetical protein